MYIKNAILQAYVDKNGSTEIDRETFIQADPEGFEAIQATYGTYADFMLAVREKTAVKPTVAPVKSVAKSGKK